MSSARIFIDKDNAPEITLIQDGATVSDNVVTKVELYIPGTAFTNGTAQVLDTDGANMTLTANSTKVSLDLGGIGMKVGTHTGNITVFDSASVNGTAWAKLIMTVRPWVDEV